VRGSKDDELAFLAMDALDESFKITDHQRFLDAFLRVAVSMMMLPYETQLALIETDAWKRCETRLNDMAEAEKGKVVLKDIVKPNVFVRFMRWIGIDI
jgi:hypothetical protein